ncbi:MAG: hypothetical protein NTZ50_13920 [Chloroflexi bacterium]|nr:hypothetical protein [Chloroflexota bacterium]
MKFTLPCAFLALALGVGLQSPRAVIAPAGDPAPQQQVSGEARLLRTAGDLVAYVAWAPNRQTRIANAQNSATLIRTLRTAFSPSHTTSLLLADLADALSTYDLSRIMQLSMQRHQRELDLQITTTTRRTNP